MSQDAFKATGSDVSSHTNGKEGSSSMLNETSSGSKDTANSSKHQKKDDSLDINNRSENSGDQGNDVNSK